MRLFKRVACEKQVSSVLPHTIIYLPVAIAKGMHVVACWRDVVIFSSMHYRLFTLLSALCEGFSLYEQSCFC